MEEIAISHYNNNNNVSLRQHPEILKKNGYTRSSVLKRQNAITDCPWMIEEDESEFDSAYGSEDRLSSSCGLVWPRKRSQDVSDALPPVCDEEAKNDDRLSSSCGLISSKKGAAARRSENGKKDTTRSLLRPPLQRSQSSTENYESSLTNVKRDMVRGFSSEKTQQHSSGYGSEERVWQETAVHVTMTNLLSDAENSRQVIRSLKKGLQGDNEIWHPDEMRQAILNNPALQLLENINLQDLNPEKDFFLDGSMPEGADEPAFSVTVTGKTLLYILT
ncbi:uncharacterized protein [Diadema setosum]|uniref:uncharacterized protein n=1 Tax=Diadema setosum TaxID=31175 RepID=UPI003B3B2379